VLVIGGPTASGKTELAVALAERFGAEIVAADSRQVYRGMSIGTAAPTFEQRAAVPHHLIDFLDPGERYSAARFAGDATATIDAIHARGRRAIVAGGTGFYIRALTGAVALSDAFDPALRLRLAREARTHPPEVLHAWLRSRDPARAAVLAPADRYRIVRALEIALADPDGDRREAQARPSSFSFLKLWLDVSADELSHRIEQRVDTMLASGFIEEAERIGRDAVAADAVGYPDVFAYLDGLYSRDELRTRLIRQTRRYAKRQRTWFRWEPEAQPVAAAEREGALDAIAALARERLGWV